MIDMKSKSLRYYLLGQISLFVSIGLCVLLLPKGLSTNDGISYYSGHKSTFFPYSLGLLATAAFTYKAVQTLPKTINSTIKNAVMVIPVLLLVLVIFPYNYNRSMQLIHTLLSSALILYQLLLAGFITLTTARSRLHYLLLGLLFIEIIVSLFYLSPVKGYLLEGEIAFELTFGLLFYRLFRMFSATTGEKSTSNRASA